MKRYVNPRGTLIIMAVAIALMVLIELFILPLFSQDAPSSGDVVSFEGDSPLKGEDFDSLPQPQVIPNAEPEKRSGLGDVYGYPLIAEFNTIVPKDAVREVLSKAKPEKVHHYRLKNPDGDQPARIAIIIDDMGMNRKMSNLMSEIEGVPMTLAFLPYAPGLDQLTAKAHDNGHELMIHMPMEPMDSKIDTGPIALRDGMTQEDVRGMLKQAFDSFDGYGGLNNHMGSRVTQNSEIMGWVMDELGQHDLFYVDSKTISTSVGAGEARKAGLSYAERDVFLDHQETQDFVRKALEKAEKVALEQGYAIAIGHPKDVTYAGLAEWLPTLEARGFEVVPVSDLLMVTGHEPEVVAAHEKQGEVVKLPQASSAKGPLVEQAYMRALADIVPAAGDLDADQEADVRDEVSSDQGKGTEMTTEALLAAPSTSLSDDEKSSSGLYSLENFQ